MRDPRGLRRRAGTAGDPSSDQYFLEDARVLDRIVDYAREAEIDLAHVLEIGPGTGALTARLLAAAGEVTTIERDRDLAGFLEHEFHEFVAADRLTVIAGDALTVTYPDFTASISNLPYGISSEVLFRLLPRRRPLIVMVQREFGERMAAEPDTGTYGRLSVSAQHFGRVEVLEVVPPSAFEPSPPVESAIVRIIPRAPAYEVADEAFFLQFVKALFTQRRKTLRNAIRNTTHISRIADAAAVLDELDEETCERRPGELAPETFASLGNAAYPHRESDS